MQSVVGAAHCIVGHDGVEKKGDEAYTVLLIVKYLDMSHTRPFRLGSVGHVSTRSGTLRLGSTPGPYPRTSCVRAARWPSQAAVLLPAAPSGSSRSCSIASAATGHAAVGGVIAMGVV